MKSFCAHLLTLAAAHFIAAHFPPHWHIPSPIATTSPESRIHPLKVQSTKGQKGHKPRTCTCTPQSLSSPLLLCVRLPFGRPFAYCRANCPSAVFAPFTPVICPGDAKTTVQSVQQHQQHRTEERPIGASALAESLMTTPSFGNPQTRLSSLVCPFNNKFSLSNRHQYRRGFVQFAVVLLASIGGAKWADNGHGHLLRICWIYITNVGCSVTCPMFSSWFSQIQNNFTIVDSILIYFTKLGTFSSN